MFFRAPDSCLQLDVWDPLLAVLRQVAPSSCVRDDGLDIYVQSGRGEAAIGFSFGFCWFTSRYGNPNCDLVFIDIINSRKVNLTVNVKCVENRLWFLWVRLLVFFRSSSSLISVLGSSFFQRFLTSPFQEWAV